MRRHCHLYIKDPFGTRQSSLQRGQHKQAIVQTLRHNSTIVVGFRKKNWIMRQKLGQTSVYDFISAKTILGSCLVYDRMFLPFSTKVETDTGKVKAVTMSFRMQISCNELMSEKTVKRACSMSTRNFASFC